MRFRGDDGGVLEPRRLRGDLGVLIVEAAFAFPIFLTLLFGVVDLGYAEFQTSQATSAARDGARAGILSYTNADTNGSADNTAIVTQVMARLPNQTVQSITVSCLSGLTGSTTIACSSATVDQDRIRVVVAWQYNALSPIMAAVGPTSITGTATMAIVGTPATLPATTSTTTTTTASTSCVVTGLTVNPSLPLVLKNNTTLQNDTSFTATTNGDATCSNLKIQLPTAGSPTVAAMTFAGNGSWTINVDKNAYNWTAGNNLSLLIQSSSGTTLTGGSFTIAAQ